MLASQHQIHLPVFLLDHRFISARGRPDIWHRIVSFIRFFSLAHHPVAPSSQSSLPRSRAIWHTTCCPSDPAPQTPDDHLAFGWSPPRQGRRGCSAGGARVAKFRDPHVICFFLRPVYGRNDSEFDQGTFDDRRRLASKVGEWCNRCACGGMWDVLWGSRFLRTMLFMAWLL